MNQAPADRPEPATVRSRFLAPWRTHRWLGRSLLALVALLGLLLIFVQFALPGIVRAQAERAVAQSLHRRLTIDEVQIHPFGLAVSIVGARLFEADGQSVFTSFARLDVRLSPATFIHLAPVVRELRLVDPYVHLARSAVGHYNTDDMMAALAGAPAGVSAQASAEPPRFAVHNIQIEGGRLAFDDVPANAHHSVTGLTLGLPFLSTFASEEEVFVEPHLAAVINGAPLSLRGRARPFAPARDAQVDLDVDNIDLARYLVYLPADAGLRVPAGSLDLHLHATFAQTPSGAPHLGLGGTVQLNGLALALAPSRTPIRFQTVQLDIGHANLPAGPLDAALTIDGKGRVAVRGETALAPLHADLALTVEDLNLLPLQTLFADRVNLRLTRAALLAQGRVRLDQEPGGPLHAEYQGNARLARLATIDSVNNNDFVNWDELAAKGIRCQLAPVSLHIDELALSNFFARIIINPQGAINLQQIVRKSTEAQRSLTDAGASPADASARPAPNAPVAPAATSALPPISIDKIVLRGGHVRFTDNFIQPHYSADLGDLRGSLVGMSSQENSAANIDLHGQVNGAALLIGGTVNPLRKDLTLDIKASVRDMELAPLSPYSGKYAGYRIERGKLSFDVAYQLQDRQLQAQNRLVLDQLTFGERVQSASATSLPVQLAIALLKDRNGVIDINLPIGGSLDDPQFSIGGLIVQVLVNLVTKAVTAPFALLGNLFGGGEELSWIEFAPGQSDLAPAALLRLQGLAKALAERPGLQLDITGWADPAGDTAPLQQRALDAKLRALKRDDLAAHGALIRSAEVVVAPQEVPGLITRLYQAQIAPGEQKKSATAASAPQAPPDLAQMEQALRAQQSIGEEELRRLGNARAQSAKEWLRTIGHVPEERLALVAAHLGPAAGKPENSARVEFSLR